MPAQHLACRLVAGAILLAVLAGCRGSAARPKVEGKVTHHGAPVANHSLILAFDAPPGESFSQTFDLAEDGSFSGEVPRPGAYKVVLAKSRAAMEGGTHKADGGDRAGIPAKYSKAATSDVTVTINPGPNKLDIELKD